jgi:hypothetical protein
MSPLQGTWPGCSRVGVFVLQSNNGLQPTDGAPPSGVSCLSGRLRAVRGRSRTLVGQLPRNKRRGPCAARRLQHHALEHLRHLRRVDTRLCVHRRPLRVRGAAVVGGFVGFDAVNTVPP